MRARIGILTLLLIVPGAAARAAGGYPFGADAGPAGVVTPTSTMRYVAIPTGNDTVLERIQRAGGQISASRTLHGRLAVPAIAIDGTAGGLSADGRTLVLITPLTRFPVSRSPIVIVDTQTLRVHQVSLKGTFAFDAVSPDGQSLYLTQYPSRDVSQYVVRRFDVARGRLAAGAIVDRRNPSERMRGAPLTRATSPGGRWAYTLYDGAGHAPFIHALDTTGRRAFCIDLDGLQGSQRLYSLRLQLDPGVLRVLDRDETVATVNTATFHVTDGGPVPTRTRRDPPAATEHAGGAPWLLVVGAAMAVALGLGALRITRRRQAVVSR